MDFSQNVYTLMPPLEHSNPFISVDYWITKSHICLDLPYKDIQTVQNRIKIIGQSHKRPILFIRTDLLPYYIHCLQKIDFPYILITASNDVHCVPTLFMPPRDKVYSDTVINTVLENKNLIRWYTKNPAFIHTKLRSVPLGAKWQWKTTQFFGESKKAHMNIFNEHCLTPKQNILNSNLKTGLLYFNFSVGTTDAPVYSAHKNIRNVVKNTLIKNNFSFQENMPFPEYIKTLKKYKFSASPPGRGIDTHRTWESLMVGTIPIIMHTTQDHLFEQLPVLLIHENEWSTITPERLEQEYKKIVENIDQYNFDILYTPYWDTKMEQIRNDSI